MYKSQSARRTVFADAQRNNIDFGGAPSGNFNGFGVAKQPLAPVKEVPSTPPKQKVAAHDNNAGKPTPPLPRQNSKAVPPSPPAVIRDMSRSLVFTRLGLLGEGGFARVYEVKDMRSNRLAIKVVTKASLKTKKAKTKLYAEIKIHKSLQHPNVVQFNECFEDTDNVYMTLELCDSGSVMDMLRKRRRFTESEGRFFMVQVIGACNFMHNNQIIHRDLKLGNLFLDANMNIKVGDFGLAALIENPGDRKKTICGTPNYIAPEILFDTANGHSFEVDIWSIGVILYTFVIGRPPFQTKEVKTIYKRIRDNQYEWPVEKEVSEEAKGLVQQILTPDPQARPTLHDILDHSFFTAGAFPSFIPPAAKEVVPDFRHISKAMSLANLTRCRKACWLDEEDQAEVTAASASKSSVGPSLAEQEREFQKAVQPGSPISALLSSARQPLVIAPPPRGEVPLIRKLQQAMPRERASTTNLARNAPLENIKEEEDQDHRRRELESQKARIVAQMVPVSASTTNLTTQNSVPGFSALSTAAASTTSTIAPRPASTVRSSVVDENVPPSAASVITTASTNAGLPKSKKSSLLIPVVPPSASKNAKAYDLFARTLNIAFQVKKEGKLFRDPTKDTRLPHNRVFIVSWVDYCNKYGMGYALTDGSVGVHFNDSTSMLLSADKQHVDYLPGRTSDSAEAPRSSYELGSQPAELKTKVSLLKHFEKYMMDRLYGEYDYVFQDLERTSGMDYVVTYLRMKQVIVFKLSHEAIQFNFYDHSKLILSSQGLVVTHIDKQYRLTHWTLSDLMRRALLPPPSDPEAAKFEQKLIDKLKYARDVLHSIINAQEKGLPASEENATGAC